MVHGPAAAQYPPDRPTCAVDRTQVDAGEQLTVSGERWQPGSGVLIEFQQNAPARTVGRTATDADGRFSTNVTIPEDARPGPARLIVTARDASGNRARCTIHLTIDETQGEVSCRVDDSTVSPGQEVRVSGGGWEPGSTVRLGFAQGDPRVREEVGTARVGDDGSFSERVRIPEEARPGRAEIGATGDSGGDPATCRINIRVETDAAVFSLENPVTPASVALLGLTALLLFEARRRRVRRLLERARALPR